MGSDRMEALNRADGRMAPGSTFQCFHGNRQVTQTILEWRPFEVMLSEDLVMPDLYAFAEFRLEPAEAGTRLTATLAVSRGAALKRLMTRLMGPGLRKSMLANLAAFKAHVEGQEAARPAPEAAPLAPEDIARAAAASLAGG
jgi:hypothetical protein